MFKPDMIQAIIEGRKTQTRRVIKPQPIDVYFEGDHYEAHWHDKEGTHHFCNDLLSHARYQVGETVYIKEAGVWDKQTGYHAYKSNMPDVQAKWKSPLFMPEWAARHFITITGVRAERLQGITEEDAELEGVSWSPVGDGENPEIISAVENYASLWNSINPKYPWESNPWVWVYRLRLKEGQWQNL